MTDTTEAPAPETSEPEAPGPIEPRGEIAGGLWRLGLVIAATLGLGVVGRFSIVLTVVAVIFMIFLHELGHYLTAKWGGMKVTEFFIGFGPKIWSFRRGETEYGLKSIPAGAYVRIIGMHNLEEVPPEDESRTYRQKSYPRRLSVAVAGSTMHFIQALVLIWVFLAFAPVQGGSLEQQFTGDFRTEPNWEVNRVGDGTAADEAGLIDGDRILSIDGTETPTFDALSRFVVAHPGDDVTLTVDRAGEQLSLDTTLGIREDSPTEGFLGISFDIPAERLHAVEAVPAAIGDFAWLMKDSTLALADFFTPDSLGNFFSKVAPEEAPAAPVPGSPDLAPAVDENPGEDRLLSIYGAVRLGADAFDGGWERGVFFLISINVFVGIFNLIPLLPFDGGHVAIATYERIRSRKDRRHFADVGKLLPLTYAVVLFVVVLGLTSLYLDVAKPLS